MTVTEIANGIFGKVITTDFDVIAERTPAVTVADDAERGVG